MAALPPGGRRAPRISSPERRAVRASRAARMACASGSAPKRTGSVAGTPSSRGRASARVAASPLVERTRVERHRRSRAPGCTTRPRAPLRRASLARASGIAAPLPRRAKLRSCARQLVAEHERRGAGAVQQRQRDARVARDGGARPGPRTITIRRRVPRRAPAARSTPAAKSAGTASIAAPCVGDEDAGLPGGDERGARRRAPLSSRVSSSAAVILPTLQSLPTVRTTSGIERCRARRAAIGARGRRTPHVDERARRVRARARPARDRRRGTCAARRARPSRARAPRAPCARHASGRPPPCGAMPISSESAPSAAAAVEVAPPPGCRRPRRRSPTHGAAGARRVDHRQRFARAGSAARPPRSWRRAA